MKQTGDTRWKCPKCGHINIDIPEETATPICAACDAEFPEWDGVEYVDAARASQ